MGEYSTNLKYDHIFVIVRVDDYEKLDVPIEERVMLTRAFWSEKVAKAEVDRLNLLNEDKSCQYFYHLARLERREPG